MKFHLRTLGTISGILIGAIIAFGHRTSAPPQEIVIWVWDGAAPPPTSKHLALVVEHLWLRGNALLSRSRADSPALASNMTVTPVVHVEVDLLHPPPVPQQYRLRILEAVLQASQSSTSGWVQLDYEAPPSHKEFFKGLVHEIRQSLSPNIKLSITTLAWWCSAGNWLDQLDADEIVPMFFRMGKDGATIHQLLEENSAKLTSSCRTGRAGFALQEKPASIVLQRYAKIYLFDYQGWKGKTTWSPASAH